MASLLALDLALGAELERALERCVDNAQAFCVLDQRLSSRARAEQRRRLGAHAVLDSDGRHELEGGESVDDDIGLVMQTSGSSGVPKAAQLSWAALRASAELTQRTLRCGEPPVWLPCLPASHIGGLAVLLRAVLADASLLWLDSDDVSLGPAQGATHVAVVRTQLARYDVSQYRRVLLGGAKPPGDRPPNVVTTWGMTETGSGVVYDGRALPGVEVASVDGEFCVRSPTLFTSYRDRARPTIAGPDGKDNWFPTGDGGEVVDGVVRIFGRLGSVINSGGEKIWPEDLEAVLASLEGVLDVAVTGVEDPEWGQRVVAFVVSDGRTLDDALRDAADERLGPWAKPKEIRYVAAIPRTSNGKTRRGDLENLH